MKSKRVQKALMTILAFVLVATSGGIPSVLAFAAGDSTAPNFNTNVSWQLASDKHNAEISVTFDDAYYKYISFEDGVQRFTTSGAYSFTVAVDGTYNVKLFNAHAELKEVKTVTVTGIVALINEPSDYEEPPTSAMETIADFSCEGSAPNDLSELAITNHSTAADGAVLVSYVWSLYSVEQDDVIEIFVMEDDSVPDFSHLAVDMEEGAYELYLEVEDSAGTKSTAVRNFWYGTEMTAVNEGDGAGVYMGLITSEGVSGELPSGGIELPNGDAVDGWSNDPVGIKVIVTKLLGSSGIDTVKILVSDGIPTESRPDAGENCGLLMSGAGLPADCKPYTLTSVGEETDGTRYKQEFYIEFADAQVNFTRDFANKAAPRVNLGSGVNKALIGDNTTGRMVVHVEAKDRATNVAKAHSVKDSGGGGTDSGESDIVIQTDVNPPTVKVDVNSSYTNVSLPARVTVEDVHAGVWGFFFYRKGEGRDNSLFFKANREGVEDKTMIRTLKIDYSYDYVIEAYDILGNCYVHDFGVWNIDKEKPIVGDVDVTLPLDATWYGRLWKSLFFVHNAPIEFNIADATDSLRYITNQKMGIDEGDMGKNGIIPFDGDLIPSSFRETVKTNADAKANKAPYLRGYYTISDIKEVQYQFISTFGEGETGVSDNMFARMVIDNSRWRSLKWDSGKNSWVSSDGKRVTIDKNFTGWILTRAVDNAGNVTDMMHTQQMAKGAIVDTMRPIIMRTFVETKDADGNVVSRGGEEADRGYWTNGSFDITVYVYSPRSNVATITSLGTPDAALVPKGLGATGEYTETEKRFEDAEDLPTIEESVIRSWTVNVTAQDIENWQKGKPLGTQTSFAFRARNLAGTLSDDTNYDPSVFTWDGVLKDPPKYDATDNTKDPNKGGSGWWGGPDDLANIDAPTGSEDGSLTVLDPNDPIWEPEYPGLDVYLNPNDGSEEGSIGGGIETVIDEETGKEVLPDDKYIPKELPDTWPEDWTLEDGIPDDGEDIFVDLPFVDLTAPEMIEGGIDENGNRYGTRVVDAGVPSLDYKVINVEGADDRAGIDYVELDEGDGKITIYYVHGEGYADKLYPTGKDWSENVSLDEKRSLDAGVTEFKMWLKVFTNGDKKITIYDKAGNTVGTTLTVTEFDTNKPSYVKLEKSTNGELLSDFDLPVNTDLTLTMYFEDEETPASSKSGIKTVYTPKWVGKTLEGETVEKGTFSEYLGWSMPLVRDIGGGYSEVYGTHDNVSGVTQGYEVYSQAAILDPIPLENGLDVYTPRSNTAHESITISTHGDFTFVVEDCAGNMEAYRTGYIDNFEVGLPVAPLLTAQFINGSVVLTGPDDIPVKTWTNYNPSVITQQGVNGDTESGIKAYQYRVLDTVGENYTYPDYRYDEYTGNVLDSDGKLKNVEEDSYYVPNPLGSVPSNSYINGEGRPNTEEKMIKDGEEYVGESDGWVQISSTPIVDFTETGTYTLQVRIISNAGNVSDISEYLILVDNTAPTVEEVRIIDEGVPRLDYKVIEITTQDDWSGLDYIEIFGEHGEYEKLYVYGGEVGGVKYTDAHGTNMHEEPEYVGEDKGVLESDTGLRSAKVWTKVFSNGLKKVKVVDRLGNSIIEEIEVKDIDTNRPSLAKFTTSETKATAKDLTITAYFEDKQIPKASDLSTPFVNTSGIRNIYAPKWVGKTVDGEKVNKGTFSEYLGWSMPVIVRDEETGYATVEGTHGKNEIDKRVQQNAIAEAKDLEYKDIEDSFIAQSNTAHESITISTHGDFTFVVEDCAGNMEAYSTGDITYYETAMPVAPLLTAKFTNALGTLSGPGDVAIKAWANRVPVVTTTAPATESGIAKYQYRILESTQKYSLPYYRYEEYSGYLLDTDARTENYEEAMGSKPTNVYKQHDSGIGRKNNIYRPDYVIDADDWIDSATPPECTFPISGVYVMQVRVITVAGNISDISEYMVSVDYEAPAAENIKKSTSNGVTKVSMNLADITSGILDATGPGTKVSDWTWEVEATEGILTFVITDGAGNTRTLVINLSDKEPEAPFEGGTTYESGGEVQDKELINIFENWNLEEYTLADIEKYVPLGSDVSVTSDTPIDIGTKIEDGANVHLQPHYEFDISDPENRLLWLNPKASFLKAQSWLDRLWEWLLAHTWVMALSGVVLVGATWAFWFVIVGLRRKTREREELEELDDILNAGEIKSASEVIGINFEDL